MERAEKNRRFLLGFFQALNSAEKKSEVLSRYITDPQLLEHFGFMENIIPRFRILVDEITAEEQRVIIKARFSGVPEKELSVSENIEIPFAMGYYIEKEKIVNHWMITDKLAVLEQLGMGRIIPLK